MAADSSELLNSLQNVNCIDEFQDWVRNQLRMRLPHAALLVTAGNLYGVGSVPTHRVSVDFPLDMIESLKNSSGALDDPLIYGWFRTEKLRHVQIAEVSKTGNQSLWRDALTRYGIRSMMIHGTLNHAARRFFVFQIWNVFDGVAPVNIKLITEIVPAMSVIVSKCIEYRKRSYNSVSFGNPTITLTSTELQIIELLAQGLSNKEIAKRRGVSDSTVKTQVQRTGAKLGATRRAEIVAIAMPMLSPLPPQNLVDYGDDGF